MEKVLLARAHKVAKWLKEGLTEIANEDPVRPLEELESLGLRTTCRLLWIRDRTSRHAQSQGLKITPSNLTCLNGHTIFRNNFNCQGCSCLITVDDPGAINLISSYVVVVGSPTNSLMPISLLDLRCAKCSKVPITCTSYYCGSCYNNVNYPDFRYPFPSVTQRPEGSANVDEVFKDEIASYESWDQ